MEATAAYLSKHSALSSMNEIKSLLNICDMYGIRDWLVFDVGVVRGLSYYTGVVFEAFDRSVVWSRYIYLYLCHCCSGGAAGNMRRGAIRQPLGGVYRVRSESSSCSGLWVRRRRDYGGANVAATAAA